MTRRTPAGPAPQKVLIVKPSALGDVITAVPVLRALRRAFPQAHLSWMLSAGCAPVVAEDADLDEVVLFQRRRLGRAWRSPGAARDLFRFLRALRDARYDWVIDLQGLFRSGFFARATCAPLRAGFATAREGAWLFYTHTCRPAGPHTIDRNLELARSLGVEARRADMTLTPTPAGRATAATLRRTCGLEGEFVLLVPPTRWETKCYPPRHWQAVAADLARRRPVALLGTAGDRALCERIADGAGGGCVSLAGQTDLPAMVALIAASACVVCSDSAAQFIAQAVGVDVVTLIGPTRAERTGPLLRGRALVAPVPCQGCLRRRCRHITCMQTIAPEAVVSTVEELLAAR